MSLGGIQALRILFGNQNLDATARQKLGTQKADRPPADDEDRRLDLVYLGTPADFERGTGGMVRPKLEGMFGPH